jgi:hypothetical protein
MMQRFESCRSSQPVRLCPGKKAAPLVFTDLHPANGCNLFVVVFVLMVALAPVRVRVT